MAESAMSEEEAAILAEFEGDDEEASSGPQQAKAPEKADEASEPQRREHGEAQAES
jgi:hypothetical protein